MISDNVRSADPVISAMRSAVLISFSISIVKVRETQLPVWRFVLALCLGVFIPSTFPFSASVCTIPIGVIQAKTSQNVGLNVFGELIIGYALAGRPIAMMLKVFKTLDYVPSVLAHRFASDLKLGLYMKIPHRLMFWCQISRWSSQALFSPQFRLGCLFSNIEELCSADQRDGFTCPLTTVFSAASIIVSYCCFTLPFRVLKSDYLSV